MKCEKIAKPNDFGNKEFFGFLTKKTHTHT